MDKTYEQMFIEICNSLYLPGRVFYGDKPYWVNLIEDNSLWEISWVGDRRVGRKVN